MHTSRDYRSRKSGLIGGEPSRGKSFLVLGPLMDLHGTGGNAVIELAPRPDWGSEPVGDREALFLEELRVEELRLVAGAVVAEEGHDGVPGSEVAREPDRARDVDP